MKPDADVEELIRLLRQYARTFSEGYGNSGRAQWYAREVDTVEVICRNKFEDNDLAEGLLTDRYWHILRDSVADTVYGPGVFRQELQHQAWRLERAAEQLEAVRACAQAGEGTAVVPDANIMVHCGELLSIDWKDVAQAERVHVILPLVVVSELDDLKRTLRDKPERLAVRTNIRQLKTALHGVKPGDAAPLADGVTIAVLPDPIGHRRLPVNDEEICGSSAPSVGRSGVPDAAHAVPCADLEVSRLRIKRAGRTACGSPPY